MSATVLNLLRALLIVSVAVATLGCGQQGPLVLPESARSIERLPNSASAPEPESQDDERPDER